MTTVPVVRAEFGLLVRYHVPWVHALPGPKRVEIEEGNEALYPSAAEHIIVERGNDDARRGLPGWAPPKGAPEARFVPEPTVRVGLGPDVVICPRKRSYGPNKNWDGWGYLLHQLGQSGFSVFAAGAPDSSDDVDCPAAWEHERFLDASIEAMLAAKLVISTDAGLAHLAMLCGAPLLLITHEGLVAPGPVVTTDGRVAQDQYWPVRLDEYYHAANHTHAPIHVSRDWLYPKEVRNAALGVLGRRRAS